MSDVLEKYGYAPGHYMNKCVACRSEHTAHKRATNCLACAQSKYIADLEQQLAFYKNEVAAVNFEKKILREALAEAQQPGIEVRRTEYTPAGSPVQVVDVVQQPPAPTEEQLELAWRKYSAGMSPVDKAAHRPGFYGGYRAALQPTTGEDDVVEVIWKKDNLWHFFDESGKGTWQGYDGDKGGLIILCDPEGNELVGLRNTIQPTTSEDV